MVFLKAVAAIILLAIIKGTYCCAFCIRCTFTSLAKKQAVFNVKGSAFLPLYLPHIAEQSQGCVRLILLWDCLPNTARDRFSFNELEVTHQRR